MIIGRGPRNVPSRIVPYRLVSSSVATPLQDRCDTVAEPLHEGLLIEHLPGQHDQNDHGSWASGNASQDSFSISERDSSTGGFTATFTRYAKEGETKNFPNVHPLEKDKAPKVVIEVRFAGGTEEWRSEYGDGPGRAAVEKLAQTTADIATSRGLGYVNILIDPEMTNNGEAGFYNRFNSPDLGTPGDWSMGHSITLADVNTAGGSASSGAFRLDQGTEHTLLHELGHAEANQFLGGSMEVYNWSAAKDGASLSALFNDASHQAAREGMGDYAQTQPVEMYAEAFAVWHGGSGITVASDNLYRGIKDLPPATQTWLNSVATAAGWDDFMSVTTVMKEAARLSSVTVCKYGRVETTYDEQELKEHLEGQHDQSSHGTWAAGAAAGGGQGDAGTTGALVSRFGLKTVRRPYISPQGNGFDAADQMGAISDAQKKGDNKIASWQKILAKEQNALLEGTGGKTVEEMRTSILTLMTQRERSGLYDPAKGTVDEQVAGMKAILDPIENEVRMLSRADAGASLLRDAMQESRKDELYANVMDLGQPFNSFIMHPDMPDIPVAGGHGYLRTTEGVPYMLEMSHFGSTNIVDGAGTAIMADFLQYAADNNVGMQLIRPTSSAAGWYSNFGFDYNGDSMKTMEMSAEQIKEWVAAYRKGAGETK